jgi:phosphate transport system protein
MGENQVTRRHFHDELSEVVSDVVRLGAMAAEAIEAGTATLLNADLAGVEGVVANDGALDELTHSIEERVYLLLARQQPMAVDLRTLVTVARVIHEVERIGDLIVKVAKATRRLHPYGLEPRVRGILDRMREQAQVQLRTAIDSFADRDPARAAALLDMDDVMDDLQKSLFEAIFAEQSAEGAVLQCTVQVALIGRYFERIGDHAANVAERVNYMVTGSLPYEDGSSESRGATPDRPAAKAATTSASRE